VKSKRTCRKLECRKARIYALCASGIARCVSAIRKLAYGGFPDDDDDDDDDDD
jgi:hypothetical protein